jgi:F0F1-type ATP synthase assembly protein I
MPPRRRTAASQYAVYTSLALLLPASTLVGYAIGYWLDKRFGTHWLTILCLILGTAGGFVQLIRQIVRDSKDDGSR